LEDKKMEYRILGKTGLRVSVLGFGCGAGGGILTGDDYPQMVRSVARAVEAGINYFDTAQIYGSGRSEENLGHVLHELKPDIIVGTKVQIQANEVDRIEQTVIAAVETSLKRLRRDQLDLFQFHNPLSRERHIEKHWVPVSDLEQAVQALQKLQASGKIRFWGINGIGETEAIHQGLEACEPGTIQLCYNLLNPSAANPVAENFPFQNYRQVMARAAERQVGVIAFRILAAGALSGQLERHPVASQLVDPIATSGEYARDVDLAKRFQYLVSEKWTQNLTEAAIRFALNRPEISTLPIGFSSIEQLDQAIRSVEKGPLPMVAMHRLPGIWGSF
jgi:aryl-alcohol dehydrogenase-like predicted oxidoreductase